MIAPHRDEKILKRLRAMDDEAKELTKRKKLVESIVKRYYAPLSAGRKHLTDDLVKIGDGSRAIGLGPSKTGLVLYTILDASKGPENEKAHKEAVIVKEGRYVLVRRPYAFDEAYPSPFAVASMQIDATTTLISAVSAQGVIFSLKLLARGVIRIDYDDKKIVVTNGDSFWMMNVETKKAVSLALPESFGLRPFHANLVHLADDTDGVVFFADMITMHVTACRIDTDRNALVHLFTTQYAAADLDFDNLIGMFALRKYPGDVRPWDKRPFYVCFRTSAALVFMRLSETDGCAALFKMVPSKNHPNVIKHVEMGPRNETVRVLYESRAAAFSLLPHARAQYETFTKCAVDPVFKNDEIMLMVRDRMLF